MNIDIILPTCGNNELINCIESIYKYTTNFNNLIIVANGVNNELTNYLNSIEKDNIKILTYKERLGYPKATNIGMKYSNADYLILLNDDVILLEQEKDTWINLLLDPFKDNNIGLTGPMKIHSPETDRDFIISFCCMVKKDTLEKLNYYDEVFSPGFGDDIDLCHKIEDKLGLRILQVPPNNFTKYDINNRMISSFPIFHKHSASYVTNYEYTERNMKILRNRYNKKYLTGSFERTVVSSSENAPRAENSRYIWANENMTPGKVLEIGCSSGYGLKYFGDKITEYHGIDYNSDIIEYANYHFGKENITFENISIYDFKLEHYDTIIAFEVLEHLEDGLEWVQKLKDHCNTLLITVPFNETPGFSSMHHKLHYLNKDHFPGFEYFYLRDRNGLIISEPIPNEWHLLVMRWNKVEKILPMDTSVTATISTKDRYHSTLPLTIMGIINQTKTPEKLIIFDDGEQKNLTTDPLYLRLFKLLDSKNISWKVIFGERKGQTLNHQKALEIVDTKYIWRIDDDEVPEYNVLEKLYKLITSAENIGAVASLVIDPEMPPFDSPNIITGSINDVFLNMNLQWFKHNNKILETEHLYSSFLYNKNIVKHKYNTNLSIHREETLFTYEIFKNNYKLLIDTSIITHHLRIPIGGIRTNPIQQYQHDDNIFMNKLKEWNIDIPKYKFIVLDNGLGDHLSFKLILPDLIEKYNNHKIIIFCCYPQVFEENINIPLLSILDANIILGDISNYNIYKFMVDHNWTTSLTDAYRELYDTNSSL